MRQASPAKRVTAASLPTPKMVDLEQYLQRLSSERRYSSHSLKAYRQDLVLLAPLLTEGGWVHVEARHLFGSLTV